MHKHFSSNRKELTIIGKNGGEIIKTYFIDQYSFLVQDLWPAHLQILLMNLLKELIKCYIKIDIIIKTVKRAELNTKIVGVGLNIQILQIS